MSHRSAAAADLRNVGTLLTEGLALHQKGDLPQAASNYREVLRLDPKQPDAHNLLGVLAQQRGDVRLAVELLKKAATLAPDTADIALNYGLALDAAGSLDLALIELDRAVTLNPALTVAYLHRGNARRKRGQMVESLADFECAIGLDPGRAEAHASRSALLFSMGYPEGAEIGLRRALRLRPDFAEAHSDLGSVLQGLGRLDEAVASYREAIRLQPGLAEAHSNLGTAMAAQGLLDDAIVAYRAALAVAPAHLEALLNLGLVQQSRGEHQAAAEAYQAALAAHPGEPAPYLNLGTVLLAQGETNRALAVLEAGLRRFPEHAGLRIGVGNCYKALGRLDEAATSYRDAFAGDPTQARAATNLGNVLFAQGDLDGALEWHQTALRLDPSLSSASLSLGNVFKAQGRALDAIAAYQEALRLRPGYPEAEFNVGNAWRESGEPGRAVAAYERALALRPDYPEAEWNRALALLSAGDWNRGWPGYERRWQMGGSKNPASAYPAPLWSGQPLEGKRILVWREQGLGDELLFGTLLGELIDQASEVRLVASPRLVTLFQRAFPSIAVTGEGTLPAPDPKGIDYHVPLGRLPMYLRPTVDDFPSSGTYLRPDPIRRAAWDERLVALGAGPRVGICWRSGMLTAERRRHYSDLADWGPLFAIPGVQWINLQYDECAEEIAEAERRFGVAIHRWPGDDLRNDLEGVTALVSALDLVVTAPTAVSSIAGAAGVACLQLDSGSDWTVAGRVRNPWFPTLVWSAAVPEHPTGRSRSGPWRLKSKPRSIRWLPEPRPEDDERRDHVRHALQTPSRLAFARGLEAQRLGQSARAIAEYRRALSREPGFAAAHFNLAQLLREAGDYEGAAAAFEGAARLRPMAADAWQNLGSMYERLERYPEAIDAYTRSIACAPADPVGYYNRGNAYLAQGDPKAAVASFREAVEADPTHSGSQWNLGCALLAQGSLAEGWKQYEHRWAQLKLDPTRGWPWPVWNGEAVAGKRLLVWREQGLGDELLFVSAVRDLVAAGGEVTLVASPRLVGLLQRSLRGVEVIGDPAQGGTGEVRPATGFDFHVPLGSLPRHLRATRDAFPVDGKFLVPDSAPSSRWATRLDALDGGIKVGICWRSGLVTDERRRQYATLEEWAPLFRLPGVHWINLQYGECAAEIKAAEQALGIKIHRWPKENLKDDLESVAGLLSTLDAVVTAPTAVSSLAGAVGVPTWEVDAGGDWTAFGEDRSPWFPAIRMVRRLPTPDGWSKAFARVADELKVHWPTVMEPIVP